jgi:hypothetical protein
MHEYGIGLREMDTFWRPGRTLLYLRKIGERYERQNKKQKRRPEKTMTEAEMMKSEFAKG